MNQKSIKRIAKMLPTFIAMCENDFEEAEHVIDKPLSSSDYKEIGDFITMLNTYDFLVDQNIFKEAEA